MLQQINLYKQINKTPTSLLTLEVVIIFYIVFTFLLLCGSIFDAIHNHNLSKEVIRLMAKLDEETINLTKVKQQYPSVNVADLENSMKALRQGLGSKNEIVAILSRQTSFASYLTSLSNAVINGIWL